MTGGHGHVVPRLDGAKARSGGPALCSVCAFEAVAARQPVSEDAPDVSVKAAMIETEIMRGLLDSLSAAVLQYHPEPHSLRTFAVGCRVAAGLSPEGDQ